MPIKVRSGGAWVQVAGAGADGQDGQDGAGGDSIPTGVIVMYNGNSAPTGWVLCDNSAAAQAAGAPDLRDKFVVGTGNGYSIGSQGGSNDVTLLSNNLPSHTHGAGNYSAGSQGAHQHDITDRSSQDSGDGFQGYQEGQGGSGSNNVTSSNNGAHTHTVTGTSGANSTQGSSFNNRPPYYALAYIMKT